MFRQSTKNHYPVFGVVVMSLDSINGWSIQSLLRGENDSKQSDEIQATSRYVLRKPKGVQKVDSYTYILYKVYPPQTHTSLSMWDVPLLFTAGASCSKGG